MGEKTLLLTLRVKVTDLPAATREQYAREMEMEAADLPGLEDVEPREIGLTVADAITCEAQDEFLWAGSDTYVHLAGAEVISAGWEPTDA